MRNVVWTCYYNLKGKNPVRIKRSYLLRGCLQRFRCYSSDDENKRACVCSSDSPDSKKYVSRPACYPPDTLNQVEWITLSFLLIGWGYSKSPSTSYLNTCVCVCGRTYVNEPENVTSFPEASAMTDGISVKLYNKI